MKILLTGASGFLGKVMQAEWKDSAEIITAGRQNAMVICNLVNQVPKIPSIDMVVHAAGKAHLVPKSPEECNDFFQVNIKGTQNLLMGLEQNLSLRKFVFVSSVSVYGLCEGIDITENAPLLARDPYGKSKIEAEKLIFNWCKRKNIEYYILRLPVIAGKNPPSNLGSMVKAIKKGWYFSIGNAGAQKSIVLARDVAALILRLNNKSGIYNLTDGCHPSFEELEKAISFSMGKLPPLKISQSFAKLMAITGDVLGKKFPINSRKLKKIQSTLTFSDKKARKELDWNPNPVIEFYCPIHHWMLHNYPALPATVKN